ncbi:MAG: hypothetical protein EXS02_14265 [Planctomycetes bacterium]|nr:hypothetical protein [Planctomycetota bacterium]
MQIFTHVSVLLGVGLLATGLVFGQGLNWVPNPANGHLYAMTQAMSWAAAEALGVQQSGHLATIRNAQENAWLLSTFGSSTPWIGFNDFATEGSFVWSSGEPVTYTNWPPGEPNNQGGKIVSIY